jgi:hypothetical protein
MENNMNRKGDLIFWSIREMNTTKEKLEELGLAKYVPRNDYKTTLIKALIKITKGNEKLYRRFNDKGETVSFTIFASEIIGGDMELRKDVTVQLHKKTGVLTTSTPGPFFEIVKAIYLAEAPNINAQQFRSVLLKMVKKDFKAITMRTGGGIYYVDKRYDTQRASFLEVFKEFPNTARLNTIPVYDDAATLDAIETMAAADLTNTINTLIEDVTKRLEKKTITKRQLEGQVNRIQEIMDKTEAHAHNLRSKAAEIRAKLITTRKAVEVVAGRVDEGILDPRDFIAALGDL